MDTQILCTWVFLNKKKKKKNWVIEMRLSRKYHRGMQWKGAAGELHPQERVYKNLPNSEVTLPLGSEQKKPVHMQMQWESS